MAESIILKCNGCSHQWAYRGKNKEWCTCPKCRNKVSIRSCQINNSSNSVEESKEEAMPSQNVDGINPKLDSPKAEDHSNFLTSSTTPQQTKGEGEDALVVDSNAKSNPSDSSESAELQIFEEKEESTDPNDYDWRCSVCAELFNTEGNIYNNKIKCPDCGLEIEYNGAN